MTPPEHLHEDAQVAMLVWYKLLPPFTGSLWCSDGPSVLSRTVMSRSLALTHSVDAMAFAVFQ